jgi:hypothetical protein
MLRRQGKLGPLLIIVMGMDLDSELYSVYN